MRRLRWIIPASAVIAAVIGFGALPASANSLGTYNGSGVRIRNAPSVNSSTVYGLGYFGQHACTYFATTGDTVNGDPYWDYNADLSTGVHAGYSADYYMYPFYYGQSC